MRLSAGFTLIELVLTVAIVGILASAAVPLAELGAQRAKESELRSALRQIREALDEYKRAYEDGRILRRADGNGYPRSLDELAEGVEDVKSAQKTRIVFLRRVPRDPFHPRSDIPAADTWRKRAYASAPDAQFEGEDVFDVHSLSPRLGLNGRPYQDW